MDSAGEHRETELETSPSQGAVVRRNRGPMSRGDHSDDREAEPATPRVPVPGLLEPNEPVEDAFALGRRDPLAVIIDGQDHLRVGLAKR